MAAIAVGSPTEKSVTSAPAARIVSSATTESLPPPINTSERPVGSSATSRCVAEGSPAKRIRAATSMRLR